MEFTAYENYQQLGIDWLVQIPKHWQLLKGKFIGKIATTPSLSDDKITQEKTSLCYIKVAELNHVDNSPSFSNGTLFSIDEELPCTSNAIIFPKRGEAIFTNKASILKIDALLDPNLMSWEIDDGHDLKYYYYALLSRRLDDIADTSTVPQINNKHIMPMLFPAPPLEEQQKIATFLDHKTQQIDQLIAKKKTLIEKLEEKRIAVITQAVTKGMDKNAKLVPSGVDWLGDVPEGWEVKRTKFNVSHIGSGKTPSGGAEVYIDDGVLLLRSQNIYDDGLRLSNVVHITDEADQLQIGSRVQGFDVLLNITGASIGRASSVPEDFPISNVNQHVCIIRPMQDLILSRYLHLLLCSQPAKSQIMMNQVGTSREGLTFPQIGDLTFPVPSLSEQQKILDFYDKEKAYGAKQVDRVEQAIVRLEEYRSALITAAVTGKIDVRNWQLPEK